MLNCLIGNAAISKVGADMDESAWQHNGPAVCILSLSLVGVG